MKRFGLRCGITIKASETQDLTNIKSEKALRIAMKLQKGREAKAITPTEDQNIELGNIISALVTYEASLNYLNIWDYTVYQLWDSFYRHCHKMAFDRYNHSTSIWGDKTNQFKIADWYKKMDLDN